MEKPITVLTGLDYWLDNLMCNVPELAMCYHIDGIVQVKEEEGKRGREREREREKRVVEINSFLLLEI